MSRTLVYAAGAIMFLVFILNLYVGLVDRNLFFPPDIVITPHYYLNWVIAAGDLASSALLLLKPTTGTLLKLSGIVWPVVYLGALGLDVDSRLCIGAPPSTCFPTAVASAQYLFFGSTSFAPVYFWHYTFMLVLALLVSTVILSSMGLSTFNRRTKALAQGKKEEAQDSKESDNSSK
jgi:hypothetical protein